MALLVSSDAYFEISLFCTGPRSSVLAWGFGLLHLSFLGLFALGMASLPWRVGRLAYVLLILAGFAALPVQAALVHAHVLKCDGP